jgi:hypothetical protein
MLTVENLKKAFADAFRRSEASATERHRARSAAWVACHAAELRVLCAGLDVTVFTRDDKRHFGRFGLNELLYDVSICQTATLSSPRGKPLRYITRAGWLVESELREGDSTA